MITKYSYTKFNIFFIQKQTCQYAVIYRWLFLIQIFNNEENAEYLSLQLQSSNGSTIGLTEESSSKLKTKSTSTTYQQITIDHGVSASKIVKPEIIWTLFSVARGFSNNSAKDIHSTFETMFPDSAIASSFQLGPDKLKYITNWGIAPYVNEQLRNNIDKVEYVVLMKV